MASGFDMYSDWVINDRTFSNIGGDMTVIYNYVYLGSYGIGFGFPLLLGLPDDTKNCGARDFIEVMAEYQLDQGIDSLLKRGGRVKDLRSVLSEFQSTIGSRLSCIDGSENIHSLKAVNGLSNLIAAMSARLDAEEAEAEANRRMWDFEEAANEVDVMERTPKMIPAMKKKKKIKKIVKKILLK